MASIQSTTKPFLSSIHNDDLNGVQLVIRHDYGHIWSKATSLPAATTASAAATATALRLWLLHNLFNP